MNESGPQEPVIALSNASERDLPIWFEPWCDEINLPPRAEMTLVVEGVGELPELALIGTHITVYGAARTRLHVLVDGVTQDTGSRLSTVPDMGQLSTREFVDMVFGNFPEARPRGVRLSGWHSIRALFAGLFKR